MQSLFRRVYSSSSYRSSSVVMSSSSISESLLVSTSIGHSIGGDSHKALVKSLIDTGVLFTPSVIESFKSVDRGSFAPSSTPKVYQNNPIKLTQEYDATCSTPQHHAQILEISAASISPGASVADFGAGSGYLAAVWGMLVGPSGSVLGIEIIPELAERAQSLVDKIGLKHVSMQRPTTTTSNKLWLPEGQLFDFIHIGFAMQSENAVNDLASRHVKPGGALLVPLGPPSSEQILCKFEKSNDGKLIKTKLMSVLCQEFLSEIPKKETVEALPTSEDDLQQKLKAWRKSFEDKFGRKPSREDISKDTHANELFNAFSLVRRKKW